MIKNDTPHSIETIYCVKWALSTGVYRVTHREDGRCFSRHGNELARGAWARGEAEAIRAVKRLVVTRREGLLKALAKLDAIEQELAAGALPMAKVST